MVDSTPVLRWCYGPEGVLIARISKTDDLPFYQISPVLDNFQLVLVRPAWVELLGTHPTLEAAQATARTHVGDDE